VFVGGLYIDQTGVFGGDLIVVSGGTGSDPGDTGGAVWRVTASGHATKLAQVSNPANGPDTQLEGQAQLPGVLRGEMASESRPSASARATVPTNFKSFCVLTTGMLRNSLANRTGSASSNC